MVSEGNEYSSEDLALTEDSLEKIVREVHACAVEHGWWDKDRSVAEILLNINGEVLELWESYRKGDLFAACDKDTEPRQLSVIEEELADIIIRVMDFAAHHSINLSQAIAIKHNYNRARPYRHGNKLG